jgi:hypothetical protein
MSRIRGFGQIESSTFSPFKDSKGGFAVGHSTTDRAIVSNQRQTCKTAILWMAAIAIFLSTTGSAWAARGRPHLDTTLGYNVLLSDNDTLLRGVSLSFDGGDPYGSQSINVPTQAQLDALATDYGLNTVHLYLEGDSALFDHYYWV